MTKEITIVKGNASELEKRAIAAALKSSGADIKRIWARPILRKELPSRWR